MEIWGTAGIPGGLADEQRPSKELAFDAWWIVTPRSGGVGFRTAFYAGWDARAATEPGLDQLADQYLLTLDDEGRDEIYTTARGFAKPELAKFLVWLQRASQPPGDVG